MSRILLAFLFIIPPAVYLAAALKERSAPWILLTTAVFAAFYFLNFWYSLPVYTALGVLFLTLTVCSYYDAFHKYLLTGHLLWIVLTCVGVRLFLDTPILSSIISVACGFLSLFIPYILSGKKWLGMGDIVVFSSLCLLLEPFGVPMALLAASLLGLSYIGLSGLFGKKENKMAFIPLLSLSLFLVFPFQHLIPDILAAIS